MLHKIHKHHKHPVFVYLPMTFYTDISHDCTDVSNATSCAGKGFLLKRHGPVEASLMIDTDGILKISRDRDCQILLPCFLTVLFFRREGLSKTINWRLDNLSHTGDAAVCQVSRGFVQKF